MSHLLKSVVREICTLRCVGAGTGRPGLRPGVDGGDPASYPIQAFKEDVSALVISVTVCAYKIIS